ncbi:hypothetical protein ACFDR9_001599 [Janthinobacterium sp. CG_23.3]|uniref:hypothetical protein n=1 Tax=Janthinobacterium sp. CG_23.3 TaxID=3349634 RepID=UPI0038D4A081
MKERPILFNGAMVRAILDDSKTQTRRIVKPHRSDDAFCLVDYGDGWWPYRSEDGESPNVDNMEYPLNCPYGQPGDRLWVRETFGEVYDWCDHPEMPGAGTESWHIEWKYRADGEPDCVDMDGAFTGWKPSIHMPRATSRILLEIVSVRVERLNDISEADAIAEGIEQLPGHPGRWWLGFDVSSLNYPSARNAYTDLWESINDAGSWAANPWVWVGEFRRLP